MIKQSPGGARGLAQYSTENLNSGLYYWRLKDSEGTINAGKIVIIK